MRPGDTFRATFPLSGAATGTPTCKLLRNSVADTTVGTSGVITCTTADSGAGVLWAASAVIPSGYAAGDTIEFLATSTVSGITQSNVVRWSFIDPSYALTGSVTTVASSTGLTITFDATPSLNAGSLGTGRRYLSLESGLNQGDSQIIGSCTSLTGSVAVVTLAAAFSQTVSTGDRFAIITI